MNYSGWFFEKALPDIITFVYRLWSWTWRKRVFHCDQADQLLRQGTPVILALWHGDELALMCFAHRYRVATIASQSKDGELMNQVLNRFGFVTSRGSSTRGGARALLGLVRLVQKEKRNAVVTVDGPKGPRHVPKPGVFELSKHLNAPIIPGGVVSSRSFTFKKSWNQAYFPLLFSKVVLYWGDPIQPVEKHEDSRSDVLAKRLIEGLDLAQKRARRLI